MTRLGDLLDFGQLFKAFGNNQFAQISHILRHFFVKVSKSIIFLVKSFLGKIYRHLAIFFWSHWLRGTLSLGSRIVTGWFVKKIDKSF